MENSLSGGNSRKSPDRPEIPSLSLPFKAPKIQNRGSGIGLFRAVSPPAGSPALRTGSPEAAKIFRAEKPSAGNSKSFMAIKSFGKKEALDDWIIGGLLFQSLIALENETLEMRL